MEHGCDRVLVVDDDRDIAESLAEVLQSEGSNVKIALGVDAALRIIDDGFGPSVILTDLMMPGRSGEDLIAELRRRPVVREIPIVAMSASPLALARVDGRAQRCLPKPFSVEALCSTLAAVCRA